MEQIQQCHKPDTTQIYIYIYSHVNWENGAKKRLILEPKRQAAILMCRIMLAG